MVYGVFPGSGHRNQITKEVRIKMKNSLAYFKETPPKGKKKKKKKNLGFIRTQKAEVHTPKITEVIDF